jgi:hypothetical protein
MDAATLKQMLEVFAQIGEGSKEAFIWWLVFTHGLSALLWATLFPAVLFVVYRVISKAINTDEFKLRSIRDKIGVGSPGHYTGEEHEAVLRKIDELMRGQK